MRLALVLSSFLWLFQKKCLPLTVVEVLPFFDLKVQSGKAERENVKINFAFYSLIRTFAVRKGKKGKNMEAIVDRTSRTVTVRMSTRRWNRMLELEQTYKLARIIKRSMKQVEEEPSMTPEEAVEALRAL